ncbi:MAG: nucleotidyl transferase AbiEii/AbiGii toxin family protein [Cyanobacteria bacterium P01_A01_bin.84]
MNQQIIKEKSIKEHLYTIADTTNRPLEEVLTYHLLESVLRRVSDSTYVSEFVLRGGMLTRTWVPLGRRIAVDVDFLSLYAFNIEVTAEKFRHILMTTNSSTNGENDGVTFDIDSLEVKGIWLETEFPGVRINIDAVLEDYQQNIQIDIGFADPLFPPAQWIEYPTLLEIETVKLQAVTPETMFAWKLHGLVEQGIKRWRPKDLYDLMLLTTEVKLNESILTKAIYTAFSSRNTSFEEILFLLSTPQWWDRSKNRGKWKWYTRRMNQQIMLEDFLDIVNAIARKWEGMIILLKSKN